LVNDITDLKNIQRWLQELPEKGAKVSDRGTKFVQNILAYPSVGLTPPQNYPENRT
jgi:hypothetical protein